MAEMPLLPRTVRRDIDRSTHASYCGSVIASLARYMRVSTPIDHRLSAIELYFDRK